MARVIERPLWICADCAMMAANGELGQGDPGADTAHAETMAEWLKVYGSGAHLVVLEEVRTFSTSQCEGCGSLLAGERLESAIIA